MHTKFLKSCFNIFCRLPAHPASKSKKGFDELNVSLSTNGATPALRQYANEFPNSTNQLGKKASVHAVPLTRRGELDLHSMPHPPIRELRSQTEICSVVNEMQDIIDQWVTLQEHTNWNREIDEQDWKNPKRTYKAKWDKRHSESINAALSIASNAYCCENKDYLFTGYFVKTIPTGLLFANNKPALSHVSVATLVTHPGSQGCGGILMEQAAQFSQKCGYSGKLVLLGGSDAKKVYFALGFIENDDDIKLTLDPANSDKWCMHNGEWRLKKYIHQNYIG